MFWRKSSILIGVLVIMLGACAPEITSTATPVPPTAEPVQPVSTDTPGSGEDSRVEGEKSQATIGQAPVDSVEVLLLESFPIQVNLVVQGSLPDGCTTIHQTDQSREGNAFRIKVITTRPADAMCTTALVPYEEVIPLDVIDLPAGTYTVDVNGVGASFEFTMDNSMQKEPESEKTQMIYREARVDELLVRVSKADSTKVEVVASGFLPDGCTEIGEAFVTQDDMGFYITLMTKRPKDAMCTTALVPYQETITLDVAGRAAGSYTVEVNTASDGFQLP